MAIEIDEMVVRASTGGDPAEPAIQAKFAPPGEPGGGKESLEALKKAVLAECREMILEILADREER